MEKNTTRMICLLGGRACNVFKIFISKVYNSVAWMNEGGWGLIRQERPHDGRTGRFLAEPDFREAVLGCLHS